MEIEVADHSNEIGKELRAALLRALERCGNQAEGYAKDLAPVDTGAGRNSISHKVDESEPAAYIGTNLDYMIYQELGTGKYTEGGRPTPWVYQDEKGNWHYTRGNKAHPFLKPALADHTQTYKNIFEDELKNG